VTQVKTFKMEFRVSFKASLEALLEGEDLVELALVDSLEDCWALLAVLTMNLQTRLRNLVKRNLSRKTGREERSVLNLSKSLVRLYIQEVLVILGLSI